MALLDLSPLLIDPDLVDKFNVERRQEFVDTGQLRNAVNYVIREKS